ncbi:drug resistance protein, partial [Aspergillus campestris IBT 28561]
IILPSIASTLKIPASRQQWVGSAYNVAMGCTLLLWGSLADLYSRRAVFLQGSTLLALTTIIPPFVPQEIPFYIVRALQGAFAAATLPSALGILGASFSPGPRRNFAFAAHGAMSSLGSVVGNIMGGLIGASLTWQWVFWILSAVTAAISVAAFIMIPRFPSATGAGAKGGRGRDLDWVGALMSTGGILMLLVSVTEGCSLGWKRPWIPSLTVVSALMLVGFCAWQWYLEHRTKRQPLVRLSLLHNFHVSLSLLIACVFFGSFQSFLYFATYFYQDSLQLSPLDTTLRFLPAGLAGILSLAVIPKALSSIPHVYLLVFATVCSLTSPLLFSVPIPPHTSYWAWGFPAMCLCISADIVWPVLTLLIVQVLPRCDHSVGTGLLSTSNQLGRTFGLLIATAVQGAVDTHGAANPGRQFLRGLRAAQWFNTALASVALAV